MRDENVNCDGSGPHSMHLDVRVLPLPGSAALHLCQDCFNREMLWRIDRNRVLSAENRYPIPSWYTLPTI